MPLGEQLIALHEEAHATTVRAGFVRNGKGNLSRRFLVGSCWATVTVFRQEGDGFAWCIRGDCPTFSPCWFATEDEAITAALEALEG